MSPILFLASCKFFSRAEEPLTVLEPKFLNWIYFAWVPSLSSRLAVRGAPQNSHIQQQKYMEENSHVRLHSACWWEKLCCASLCIPGSQQLSCLSCTIIDRNLAMHEYLPGKPGTFACDGFTRLLWLGTERCRFVMLFKHTHRIQEINDISHIGHYHETMKHADIFDASLLLCQDEGFCP